MSRITGNNLTPDSGEHLLPDGLANLAVALPAQLTASLYGRDISVSFSTRARKAAASLTAPVLLEMELYFSCLVRKQVRVKPLDTATGESTCAVSEHLYLGFRPVVTEECRMDDLGADAPPVKTMPVKDHRAFVPHWLHVDFRNGNWCGEFGFTS